MSNRRVPPSQPKWMLNVQVFLLRHRLMGPLNREFMVITTTGRKSGRQYSVPIGFAPDGRRCLAFNLGARSNWYRNVLANPRVTLEINGKAGEACAQSLTTPEQIREALVVYARERPTVFRNYLGVAVDAPPEELLKLGDSIKFLCFDPLT